MSTVGIHGVQKYFGGTQVIRGVDIDIKDGEFTVLVGPSGCGKSTLLRMIAGLEEISEGQIMINDKVVNDMQPKERDVAMVFQNYALYPHMTVFENMAFSLKLAKFDKAEIKSRVARASQTLGLDELLERYPRQLSGGQRQRVAMGRAIVRNPQVFLFDEPLSNLDANLRVQMRTEIRELHQRLRTTSIYVTHDQIEAMTMGDQIVVMNDGRVEQRGSPLDLYDHPDNLFVAKFIGSPSMNFFTCTAHKENGNTLVEFADGTRIAAPESGKLAVQGQALVFGIRPEHVVVGVEGPGLKASVKLVELTGANTEIHYQFAGVAAVSVSNERYTFKLDDVVYLYPDTTRAHLFDAESGKNLG
ncbi:sn-glycerol-3-phosphate ABC transporter ATP-binding protein UgpC [Alcaligenaceae bacterium]|nr:sn-glycerol-3-phosphate ABC transporter ATP-binding protein UgpC [Alcaligenaceae bacterium]